MLGSSLMTRTRSAFLATADLLAQEGIEVPLIIDGGQSTTHLLDSGRTSDMLRILVR
jgi:methanogenic corrinoid protein MtbC1